MSKAFELQGWLRMHEFWLDPARKTNRAYRVAYERAVAGRPFLWVTNGNDCGSRWKWQLFPLDTTLTGRRNTVTHKDALNPDLTGLCAGYEMVGAWMEIEFYKPGTVQVLELISGKMKPVIFT